MAKDNKSLSLKSLAVLPVNEKVAKRNELLGELRKHRFTAVMGTVDNPMHKRNLRKAIARLNTMIHEHTLGKRS